jgi:hypothetical protein
MLTKNIQFLHVPKSVHHLNIITFFNICVKFVRNTYDCIILNVEYHEIWLKINIRKSFVFIKQETLIINYINWVNSVEKPSWELWERSSSSVGIKLQMSFMELSPFWKAASCAATQEISNIFETRRFIFGTVFVLSCSARVEVGLLLALLN